MNQLEIFKIKSHSISWGDSQFLNQSAICAAMVIYILNTLTVMHLFAQETHRLLVEDEMRELLTSCKL